MIDKSSALTTKCCNEGGTIIYDSISNTSLLTRPRLKIYRGPKSSNYLTCTFLPPIR